MKNQQQDFKVRSRILCYIILSGIQSHNLDNFFDAYATQPPKPNTLTCALYKTGLRLMLHVIVPLDSPSLPLSAIQGLGCPYMIRPNPYKPYNFSVSMSFSKLFSICFSTIEDNRPNPYKPLCNPRFHFTFQFLFYLILHYWG